MENLVTKELEEASSNKNAFKRNPSNKLNLNMMKTSFYTFRTI